MRPHDALRIISHLVQLDVAQGRATVLFIIRHEQSWRCAGRLGPITRAEIKQGHARGQLTATTVFWADSMRQPLPLYAVRQLRWLVAQGSCTPLDAPGLSLCFVISFWQNQRLWRPAVWP